MAATLTVLGSGSILPRAGHGCSGYALEAEAGGEITLLDCGPGTVRALGDAGIALERVRRLVFSHYHLDHCLDLFTLAFARNNPGMGDAPRLDVWGPPGLIALRDEAPASFGAWARDPNATWHELELDADETGAFDAGGERDETRVSFRCVRNGHSRERVCLSWRIDFADGASLLYTGDTDDDDRVALLGRGVTMFLAECSHPDGAGHEAHLSPSSAARLARSAGAERLVLTHFYPDMDPDEARLCAAGVFGGPVETASDGAAFDI